MQDAENVRQRSSRLIEILNGGPGRLTNSAARTDVVLLIRRTMHPKGYASSPSLAAALLNGHFAHPAYVVSPIVPLIIASYSACVNRCIPSFNRRVSSA
jgi:hypothetical protein